MLCRYAGGPPVKRWMPYGMPRLHPKFDTCTFFLFRLAPTDQDPERIVGPCGTGFFVSREWRSNRARRHVYAVTNWHVAVDDGASIIRLNTANGGAHPLRFNPEDWQYLPNKDDVAVIDVTDDLEGVPTEILDIPEERMFGIPERIRDNAIGPGEDGFMIGLFAGDGETKQNHPVTRFGNLARLATDKAPLMQANGAMRPVHIMDMRSRTGHSGSPVFIYRTPNADLSELLGEHGTYLQNITNNLFLYLIGVHVGQTKEDADVEVSRRLVQIQEPERLGDFIKEGDVISIPSGLTMVAPVYAISELLETKYFRDIRMAREDKHKGDRRKIVHPESAAPPPPHDNANPDHKEDFTRLLGAAAKTKKQGD